MTRIGRIGGTIHLDRDTIDPTKTYTFTAESECSTYTWAGIRPTCLGYRGDGGPAVFVLPGLPVLAPGTKIVYTAPHSGSCYCDRPPEECEARGHSNRSAT